MQRKARKYLALRALREILKANGKYLKSEKNYMIGTSLLDTKWAYGNDHAHHVYFRMLTGHQSMGGASACLQHAS